MTSLQLHRDDLGGLEGCGHSIFARALVRLGAACRLIHRAIVDVTMRRLQSDFAFEDNYRGEPSHADDARRFPQRPLILGDKWDF